MKVTANNITKSQILDSLSTAAIADKGQDIVGFEFETGGELEHLVGLATLTFWWFLEEGLEVTVVSDVDYQVIDYSDEGAAEYLIKHIEPTEIVLGCVNTLDYSEVVVEPINYDDLKEILTIFFTKENKRVSNFCNKYYLD